MIPPRWRKVFADLWSNKTRTALVVLSIAVGVFAVGSVTNAFVFILNDMEADYQSTNPHVAVLFTDSFDEDMLHTARRTPGVADAAGRMTFGTRIRVPGGEWKPIELRAVPDLDEITIDRVKYDGDPKTMAPLRDDTLYIERASLATGPYGPGAEIEVEQANGSVRTMKVVGVVHDAGSFPSAFTGQMAGFVSLDTMERLGLGRDYNQMLLTVTELPRDEPHVKAVAQLVARKVEGSGRQVYATLIWHPGEHPATFIIQPVMMILAFLGVLAVALSAFLVTNTMTAIISQNLRQIGVMKAVGASSWQILAMYAVLVLCYGFLALLVAVVPSALAGYGIATFIAGYLNFDLAGFRISSLALALQTLVALLVPLVAAMLPAYGGTRITVREAISSYGLGRGRFGRSRFDRLIDRIRFLSRPTLISFRNTFRRKLRLGLTLSTLVLAGAIFISVYNLRAAFVGAIDEALGYFLSDVNLSLERNYRSDAIASVATAIPDVESIEAWTVVNGQALADDGETGVDVILWAPPPGSTLIRPTMIEGRWLTAEDENALVIGNQLLKKRPDLAVGDDLVTKIGGNEHHWQIVGIYRLPGNVEPPFVYTNADYLARITGTTGRTSEFRVVTRYSDPATELRVAKELERSLRESGVRVSGVSTGHENRTQQASSINVLIVFLMVMVAQIAVVGGLGLMGTMSMNVLERTREIGVLRAVGAAHTSILRLVMLEGLFIGVLSWVLALIVSVPISTAFSSVVGGAFMTVPMSPVFSIDGPLYWLAIVLVVSAFASLWPAWNAARLTVREVLAYE